MEKTTIICTLDKKEFYLCQQLQAELEQLKKAFIEYSRHKEDCNPSPAENDCKCGYLKVLKEL